MLPILASFPVIVILLLMVVFRWGAARAGAAGYLSALLLAILAFGAGPEVLATAHGRALLLSLDVLYIIWAAFFLYRVADEAGAIKTIGSILPFLTADKGMQALLIGWVFASFLQGAGGFGVPVAVTSPLLVGLGFNPLSAVLITSIGHSWAVTFGSLGSSFQALISSTGMTADELVTFPAFFLGISALFIGLMVAHIADGWKGVKRLALPALLIGLVMGGVQYFVAAVLGLWNISAFLGGLAGLLISIPIAIRASKSGGKSGPQMPFKPLLIALSAYIVLIVMTVLILLVPQIEGFMSQVAIRVQFPETVTSLGYVSAAGTNRPIRVFSHAGAILIYSSLLSYFIYKASKLYRSGAFARITKGTIQSVISSSLSIVTMVGMAMVMQQSGMTEALAQGLANAVGIAYPAISPWIGALGAFMTGSNTNSNVVFAALQMRTAELLTYSLPIILAAQTAGAALASVVAPTKIVVGASTAGLSGKEGEVLRAMIFYIFLLILLVSVLTVAAVLIWK